MGRTELFERASHYRTMAASVTDEETTAALLELAENNEALARETAEDGHEE